MTSQTKNKWKSIAFFLIPSLIGTIIFVIWPMFKLLLISLTEWNIISSPVFVGFENYSKLLQDPEFWAALKHTFQFGIVYMPLVLVLALGGAVLLNRKLKGINFFRSIYFLPVVSSWVAVSIIWQLMLNPDVGIVNQFLALFGIEGPAWLFDEATAMFCVSIASVWKDTGFLMIVFLGGLQTISPTLYEAASIDGAKSSKQFFSITLPMLAPTMFFTTFIALKTSFQVFDQVMIMTGGGPGGSTETMVQYIYNSAFQYNEFGYAAAMSIVLFIIILSITLVQKKLQSRWDYHEN